MSDFGVQDPGYRQGATVTVDSEERLRALLSRPLDFGCRPSIIRLDNGGFRVDVIGTAEQLDELTAAGLEVELQPDPIERAEVGEGDRFAGGVVPRGFGRKDRGR